MWNSEYYCKPKRGLEKANNSTISLPSSSNIGAELDEITQPQAITFEPLDDTSKFSSKAVIQEVMTRKDYESIVPDTPWPGNWITPPEPIIKAETKDNPLWEIMENAKYILTGKPQPCQKKQIRVWIGTSLPMLEGKDGGTSAEQPDASSMPVIRYSHGNPSASSTRSSSKSLDHPQTPSESKKSKVRRSSAPVKSHKVKREKHKQSQVILPHVAHKYKKPTDVKREYRKLWNEKGKITKKDTEYLEIHYDKCLPEDEDLMLKPKFFTHNHRNGYHWEIRHRTEKGRESPIEKVERIWENEFKCFQLDRMFDKKLKV